MSLAVAAPFVAVTLTTVPARVEHLAPVLRSLCTQVPPPDAVLLHMPAVCARTGEAYPRLRRALLDAGNNRLIVNRCSQDWGPATKVMPLLLRDGRLHDIPADALLVLADDDVEYPPGWLHGLVSAAIAAPAAAVGYAGFYLGGLALTQVVGTERGARVDVLEGYAGIAVRRNAFNGGVLDAQLRALHDRDAPVGGYTADDLLLSNHLAARGVSRLVITSVDVNRDVVLAAVAPHAHDAGALQTWRAPSEQGGGEGSRNTERYLAVARWLAKRSLYALHTPAARFALYQRLSPLARSADVLPRRLLQTAPFLSDAYGEAALLRSAVVRQAAARAGFPSIFVCLTSVPPRLTTTAAIVRGLSTQELDVNAIVVALPTAWSRWPEIDGSDDGLAPLLQELGGLPGVAVLRCNDEGPATKLLPLARTCPAGSIIVTVDDDTAYDPAAAAELVAAFAADGGSAAWAAAAFRWASYFTEVEVQALALAQAQAPHPEQEEGKRGAEHGSVHDVAEGFGGVAYSADWFRGSAFDAYWASLPVTARNDDDVALSNWLFARRVPVRLCATPRYARTHVQQLGIGTGPDALSASAPGGHRDARRHILAQLSLLGLNAFSDGTAAALVTRLAAPA